MPTIDELNQTPSPSVANSAGQVPAQQAEPGLTHVDGEGKVRMVNVTDKPISLRRASASAVCVMSQETAEAIRGNELKKGDVLQVARLAGISASKRTDELIPLCHSIGLDSLDLDFEWIEPNQLRIVTHSQATARTGVEMEAMVAASVAALTVYDMCKSMDRSLRITDVQLVSKSGGVRGDYSRDFTT